MLLNRDRRDAWELRPSDLPPPEVSRREPRLADLDNNAVFRSMLFGRRTRKSMPWLESSVGLGVVMLSSAILLSCFGPLFFFIAFPLNRFFRKPQANVIAFFGMPEILLHELVDLRVPSREWSLALWGRAVSNRHRRVQSYLTLVWIALSLSWAFYLGLSQTGMFGAVLYASLFLILGIRFGITLAAYNHPPYACLPSLLQRVRRFRRATSLSNNPLGWLYTMALFLGVMLVAVLLSILLYGLMVTAAYYFPRPVEALEGSVWFLPLSAVIIPLGLGLLSGALLIPLRARHARRKADQYLLDLDGEVEGMLRIMRGRFDYEGDEKPYIPSVQFRPPGSIPERHPGSPSRYLSSESQPGRPVVVAPPISDPILSGLGSSEWSDLPEGITGDTDALHPDSQGAPPSSEDAS